MLPVAEKLKLKLYFNVYEAKKSIIYVVVFFF